MTPLLKCENFSFSYKTQPVLQNISFQIKQGEWLTIIGPNGSGKSTLLKCLIGLVRGRSSGSIHIRGKALESYGRKDIAKIFAFVSQDAPAPPFRLEEFLLLSRYAWGMDLPESRAAIEKALLMTNAAHLRDKYLTELSGGERQKAFLACAIAQGGEALLLDEPQTYLDPKNSLELFCLLQTLQQKENMAIVMVTHDLSTPFAAGGKTLALRRGRQTDFACSADLIDRKTLERTFDCDFSYIAHPVTKKILAIP